MLCIIKNTVNQFSTKLVAGETWAKCSTKAFKHTKSKKHINVRFRTGPLYGQPTHLTHPHLLKEDEIIPGITKTEFQNRRQTLVEKILQEHEQKHRVNDHIVIIPSASKVYMSDKIPYVFRQNTDFLYFSGCQEPDSVLVIEIHGNQSLCTIFVQAKNPHAELWDGPRTGVEAAISLFGVHKAFPYEQFEHYVEHFIKDHKKCVIWYDTNNVIQQKTHDKLCNLFKIVDSNIITPACPKSIIHQIRLFKSKSESELMQKSCDIASKAITKTIEVSQPGMTEHQLFANVDYECRMNGAEFLAYPPVVAAGPNANIIHYIVNNQVIEDGDLVLMDAGCEYHGYSSDITRTWPISGTFSDEQRVLYEIVLEVQKLLINMTEEMPTLDHMFEQMCLILGKRLKEIHLVPKNLTSDKELRSAGYAYCPHHVSHYLGMDVHDTGSISRNIPIQPGMILTIEPGIYVNPKNNYAPSEFHGIGIRIEDDILVQNNGIIILTRNCPKEIADIEKLAKANQI